MSANISNIRAGLAIVLLGLFCSIGLGISFGIDEDMYQDYVAQGIAEHPELHNEASADKIWRYALRTHFHAGGIAAFCLGLVILVMMSSLSKKMQAAAALLIGLGSFYPFAWLSMFYLSPSMGRGAAHEHILTKLFTFVGVGGLLAGSFILIANLFFESFREQKHDGAG